MDQPGKRKAQRVRVVEPVYRYIPRLAKGPVDAPGHPRVLSIDILAHHRRMHDRENAGAAVIILLYLVVVRKQARYARRAPLEHRRNVDRKQGVELAALQHLLQRLIPRQKLNFDFLRQLQRNQRPLCRSRQPADEPLHILQLHAVLVLQHAVHEDRGGRTELGGSHPFSPQILRPPDAPIGSYINTRMAEDFRQRYGHRDERAGAATFEAYVRAKRQLGNLELFLLQHPGKDLARAHDLDLQIDAFGLDTAVDKRTGAVVVPACESKFELRHRRDRNRKKFESSRS